MQVNSLQFAALGLTVGAACDPCRNLQAGAHLLMAAYVPPPPGADAQPALRQALSRYNTGDPARGLANGYVGRVQQAAEAVVPAIRLQGEAGSAPAEAALPHVSPPRGGHLVHVLPSDWDGTAVGPSVRSHGILILRGGG